MPCCKRLPDDLLCVGIILHNPSQDCCTLVQHTESSFFWLKSLHLKGGKVMWGRMKEMKRLLDVFGDRKLAICNELEFERDFWPNYGFRWHNWVDLEHFLMFLLQKCVNFMNFEEILKFNGFAANFIFKN